ASIKKTGRLVTVEESRVCGGWGAELAARVATDGFDSLDAPIQRIGAPDVPIPSSPALEKLYVPSEEQIVAAVRKTLQ
ncbi:MAG TPA: transketolase C-terminal domain-containing protein, partial [Chloroflexota bacterium]|nr:transketolase C-terminal domain-containing protein [Chloroflexota bacterium]